MGNDYSSGVSCIGESRKGPGGEAIETPIMSNSSQPRIRRVPGKPPPPVVQQGNDGQEGGGGSTSSTSGPAGGAAPSASSALDAKRANTLKSKKRKERTQDDVRFDRVIFLGTSSAVPVPGKRNMSSLLISSTNGSSIMVDCGEGTQHQLKTCTRAKSSNVDLICITHLHGDHCYGLFGFLLTCGQDMRANPITVVGPEGIFDLVMTVFSMSGGWAGYYDLIFVEIPHELHAKRESVDLTHTLCEELAYLRLTAAPLIHAMPCWGYVLQELDRPGKLDVAKARRLGVPNGPLLGKLKRGEDVEVPADGASKTMIRATDVVSEDVPGRKICVLQDSSDSSFALDACRNADVFIHEATLESSMKAEAIEKGHSTPHMAADWANEAGAKKLVLTHFSARYNPTSSGTTAIAAANGSTVPVFRAGIVVKNGILGTSGSAEAGDDVDMCCPSPSGGDKMDTATTSSKHLPTPVSTPRSSENGGGVQDTADVMACCELVDPADAVLAQEAREIFTRGEVVAAKDFMMLEATSTDFTVCKELVVKRLPFARTVGGDSSTKTKAVTGSSSSGQAVNAGGS
ncbi:unnamed protein product [Amoebophrya sp. A25]|nr:unnamed protein product [Amoebophrya sp. A25]|eukprot:GSA25T00010276001.1